MGRKNRRKQKVSKSPVKPKVSSKTSKEVSKRSKSPMKSSKESLSPKSKILKPSKESKIPKIKLKDEQVPQVQSLIEILKKNVCAFDMSMMGAGKTYVSSEVAIRFGFKKVIVVCPASVVGKWREMKTNYGLNLEEVLSYEALRSVQDHQPSHGLLIRYDETVGEDIEKKKSKMLEKTGILNIELRRRTRFEPTEKLKKLVSEGCLFIFDEAQKVKNRNAAWFATKTIAETLIGIAGKSRFLMLSGTPIDKEEHALNIMSMMGFIRSTKLYNTEDGDIVLIGAKELLLFCEKVNREATKETLDEFPIRRKEDVVHLCYKLFQNVIKKYMTSSIKVPENEKVKLDVKNGYYKLDDVVAMTRLRNAIDSIQSTLRKRIYRKAGGTVFNTKIQKLGAVIKQLEFIEGVKIPVFVRLAREKLEENPNAKVCIFVNYNHSIDALMNDLAEYNPIKFNGSVNKELRQTLINKFQEPNNNYRLFIGNVATSATGIDLDDKYGKFPRYAFASSNFNILDLFQLTRRIYRIDTQSNAVFRFVFIKNATEVSVLNNLARKSNILKETLDVQRESGIVFPGDFPKEEEE